MPNDPKSEFEHRKRLESYTIEVQALYNTTIQQFSTLVKGIRNIDTTKVFSFASYPEIAEKLKEVLNGYLDELSLIINRSTAKEWNAAFQKQDTRLKASPISQQQRQEALLAFQQRVENGLNLSDRVWKYTQQFQQEIELAVSSTILEGKSAALLAKEIKLLLNEPDRLFRRVRNKYGLLQLSKKAKVYHPGQGVYRSSYRNALRLARNETNIAYRSADHLRYQYDPSVVGFEVKLSNRHPVRDMCDDLKGKYPVTFKFVGWHANCLCFQTPIVVNDEDWQKIQDSMLTGEELPKGFKPSNTIDKVPDGFNNWIEDNREKSKNWKSQPYFIKDNFKDGKIQKGLNI